MVDNRKVYIQIKHHRKIEMTEKQFDIFVAPEEKNGLSVHALSEKQDFLP